MGKSISQEAKEIDLAPAQQPCSLLHSRAEYQAAGRIPQRTTRGPRQCHPFEHYRPLLSSFVRTIGLLDRFRGWTQATLFKCPPLPCTPVLTSFIRASKLPNVQRTTLLLKDDKRRSGQETAVGFGVSRTRGGIGQRTSSSQVCQNQVCNGVEPTAVSSSRVRPSCKRRSLKEISMPSGERDRAVKRFAG